MALVFRRALTRYARGVGQARWPKRNSAIVVDTDRWVEAHAIVRPQIDGAIALDEWRQSSSKRRARTSRLKVRAARAPDGTLDSMDRIRHSGTGSRVTETMVCCAAAWRSMATGRPTWPAFSFTFPGAR